MIDRNGYITDPQVRATYTRICDSRRGARLHFERVASAEAYLRLVLRLSDKVSPEVLEFLKGRV